MSSRPRFPKGWLPVAAALVAIAVVALLYATRPAEESRAAVAPTERPASPPTVAAASTPAAAEVAESEVAAPTTKPPGPPVADDQDSDPTDRSPVPVDEVAPEPLTPETMQPVEGEPVEPAPRYTPQQRLERTARMLGTLKLREQVLERRLAEAEARGGADAQTARVELERLRRRMDELRREVEAPAPR